MLLSSEDVTEITKQISESQALIDSLSDAKQYDAVSAIMRMRQALRVCLTRAITANTVLAETDAILTIE